MARPPVLESTARLGAGRSPIAVRAARRTLASDVLIISALAAVLWSTGIVVGRDALVLVGATLAVFGAKSLYATAGRPQPTYLDEARRIFGAALGGMLLSILVVGAAWGMSIGTGRALTFALWIALVVTATLAARRAIRRRMRRADPERVLIVGAGGTGQDLARRIQESSDRGGRVVGFLDEDPYPLAPSLEGIPVFGGSAMMADAVAALRPDRIIIAFTRRPAADVLEDLRCSGANGMPISVVPRYHEITPPHAQLSQIGGMPLVDIHSARLSPSARAVKRAFDIALAGAGLVVLAPVLAGVALAIKLTSPGPVLFGQLRTGRDGHEFRIWKFRTMCRDAEERRMELAELNDMDRSAPLFKMRRDPRISPIGRVLRKYSVDELPQLFNVLNGSMSLVGPRPFVVHESDQMQGWSRRRLDLTPGITGLWQVRGRNDVSYEEMIRLDYMYVANWSPLWDLRLLLETIPRVLTGKGAS